MTGVGIEVAIVSLSGARVGLFEKSLGRDFISQQARADLSVHVLTLLRTRDIQRVHGHPRKEGIHGSPEDSGSGRDEVW